MIWAFSVQVREHVRNVYFDTPKKSFSYFYENPEATLIIILPEITMLRFSFNFMNFSVNLLIYSYHYYYYYDYLIYNLFILFASETDMNLKEMIMEYRQQEIK